MSNLTTVIAETLSSSTTPPASVVVCLPRAANLLKGWDITFKRRKLEKRKTRYTPLYVGPGGQQYRAPEEELDHAAFVRGGFYGGR
jgi:hypothetical protein